MSGMAALAEKALGGKYVDCMILTLLKKLTAAAVSKTTGKLP
jgi:hypothetical protein